MASDPSKAAQRPLLVLLTSKHSFVKSMSEAGRVPSGGQIAAFLQGLVQEMTPHVKLVGMSTANELRSSFASLGWDVVSNGPSPGSSPPDVHALLSTLKELLTRLLPDVLTARASAEEIEKQLRNEERELGVLEEEALERGALTAKEERTLTARQGRIAVLKASAAEARQLVTLCESMLTVDERKAADEAEVALRGVESLRVQALTKQSAEATVGGTKARQGGSGYGGRGGRGRGGGGRGDAGRGGGGRGGGGRQGDEAGLAAAEGDAPTKPAKPTAEDAIAALRTSDITLVDASELRKGGYVLLPVSGTDQPCKINELTTSKTGKHGHAKISVTAADVATGRKVERNLRADERVTVPGKRWIMAVSPVEVG